MTFRAIGALSVALLLLLPVAPARAGVLSFDGTDDRARWTTLATALADVSDGAWTMAILLKRVSGDVGTWSGLAYLLSGTGNGTAEVGVSFKGAAPVDSLVIDNGSSSQSPSAFTSTASPYLFVVTKAAGTSTPALYWKLGSAGAWSNESFNNAVADQIDATILEIGAFQATSDPFGGWIGLVAFWEGAMSQANAEALDDNWRTSDWWNSAHGQPAFLAELNVACTSLVDLAGNASSLSCTGTTLDSGETLDSWNFNGTGAGAPPCTGRLSLLGVGC
ncbi:MAG: hypothetical protein ACREM3_23645 [Candidatus Rokuibacteriota bacterium]